MTPNISDFCFYYIFPWQFFQKIPGFFKTTPLAPFSVALRPKILHRNPLPRRKIVHRTPPRRTNLPSDPRKYSRETLVSMCIVLHEYSVLCSFHMSKNSVYSSRNLVLRYIIMFWITSTRTNCFHFLATIYYIHVDKTNMQGFDIL